MLFCQMLELASVQKKKIHISWALLFICNGSTKFCVQAAVAQWT